MFALINLDQALKVLCCSGERYRAIMALLLFFFFFLINLNSLRGLTLIRVLNFYVQLSSAE